jgi:hypothetical protein
MTYYGAKDLADSLRTVRKNTLIIAEEIPEAHYGFRAAPETRTVAQILIHIAVVQRMPEQIHAIERRTTLEGFDFPGLMRRPRNRRLGARHRSLLFCATKGSAGQSGWRANPTTFSRSVSSTRPA